MTKEVEYGSRHHSRAPRLVGMFTNKCIPFLGGKLCGQFLKVGNPVLEVLSISQ